MCGLVGVITKNAFGFNKIHTNIFTHMLYCDGLRGWDSTGVFHVNKHGNVAWAKNKFTPMNLIGQKEYKEIMDDAFKQGRVLIGHNRKATTGTISDENAHPFIDDNIILVHNGVIYNHKKHADTEVDSHAIACLIREKGHEQAIKEIDGAFALIWYDINTKLLHLARNNKRPLHMVETKDSWYIASEVEMLKWLVLRENEKIINEIPIEPGKCFSLNIEKAEDGFNTKDVELYSPKATAIVTYPSRHNGTDIYTGKGVSTKVQSKKERRRQRQLQLAASSKPSSLFSSRIAVGEKVCFTFDNYEDVETEVAHLYDGILYGNLVGNSDIEVVSYFKDEQWSDICESNNVYGIIQGITVNNGTTIVELMPSSLSNSPNKTGWKLASLNDEEITQEKWNMMPHSCERCTTPVETWEIEDSIIKFKANGNHKIICPACCEKQRKELSNSFDKGVNHVN